MFADPFTMAPRKAIETIGEVLKKQYERWQPRVRTVEQLTVHVDLYLYVAFTRLSILFILSLYSLFLILKGLLQGKA